jgi:hypothetical protein
MPTSHWLQGKCTRINLSQAATGMNLQHLQNRRFRVFEANELLKEFSKILSNIHLVT